MANREALRELQSRLATRLQAARTEGVAAAWLAVEAAGARYLFPLSQSGEIFPWASAQPVPYTQPWFLGVANLRGGLHGVVDLAAFLGVKGAERGVETGRERAQLVALNAGLEINCALLVDRLAGLRSATQLTPEPDAGEARPSFVGGRFRDAGGRLWQELRLAELAHHPAFLKIVG